MYSNRVQYVIRNLYNKNKDNMVKNKKIYNQFCKNNALNKNNYQMITKRKLSGNTNDNMPPNNKGDAAFYLLFLSILMGSQIIFPPDK